MRHVHGGNIHAYIAQHGAAPLDFSANINPLGMPEAARVAAKATIAMAEHYPDPRCTGLRAAIAAYEGVSAAQILCGNGAADLIYRFAFALRPRAALVCAPSFGEYEAALRAAGSEVRRHALRAEDGFRVTAEILPALDGVQALCLCNPNNPTGLTIDGGLLVSILDRCADKGLPVLLDECFIDFLDNPRAHTRVASLAGYPRLVLLKALTKFHGMPGLRLGYAMCADETLLSRIEAAGAPWSVSVPAQAAGVASLADGGYAAETRALIQAERPFMKQMLRQLGLSPMGEANFLLFQAPIGLADRLLAEGILVRDCASFAGLGEGWLRIAIRTRAENMRLLSRLSRCLHG